VAGATDVSKRALDRTAPHEVTVLLSLDELRTLRRLAHYYQRSMGPMRYIVRLTASAEIRAKYRFIAEESRWLEKFVESLPVESASHDGEIAAEFASRTVIAYWGRVLANLHSKRARRRMKPEAVAIREALAEKLCAAAQQLETRWPGTRTDKLSPQSREAPSE
jgi:hypothetical protein